jgi:hypothetical protein
MTIKKSFEDFDDRKFDEDHNRRNDRRIKEHRRPRKNIKKIAENLIDENDLESFEDEYENSQMIGMR